MSTDDLTARVRDHLAHADTLPHGLAIALIRELADEVGRLRVENAYLRHISDTYDEVMPLLGQTTIERDAARAEADRFRTLWDRHGKNDLLAERDAARAALERVRAAVQNPPIVRTVPGGTPPGYAGPIHLYDLSDLQHDVLNALEGES